MTSSQKGMVAGWFGMTLLIAGSACGEEAREEVIVEQSSEEPTQDEATAVPREEPPPEEEARSPEDPSREAPSGEAPSEEAPSPALEPRGLLALILVREDPVRSERHIRDYLIEDLQELDPRFEHENPQGSLRDAVLGWFEDDALFAGDAQVPAEYAGAELLVAVQVEFSSRGFGVVQSYAIFSPSAPERALVVRSRIGTRGAPITGRSTIPDLVATILETSGESE